MFFFSFSYCGGVSLFLKKNTKATPLVITGHFVLTFLIADLSPPEQQLALPLLPDESQQIPFWIGTSLPLPHKAALFLTNDWLKKTLRSFLGLPVLKIPAITTAEIMPRILMLTTRILVNLRPVIYSEELTQTTQYLPLRSNKELNLSVLPKRPSPNTPTASLCM